MKAKKITLAIILTITSIVPQFADGAIRVLVDRFTLGILCIPTGGASRNWSTNYTCAGAADDVSLTDGVLINVDLAKTVNTLRLGVPAFFTIANTYRTNCTNAPCLLALGVSTGNITFTGGNTLTVSGDVNIDNGLLNLNNGNMIVNGNVNINASGGTGILTMGNGTLTVLGNVTINGGTLNMNTGTLVCNQLLYASGTYAYGAGSTIQLNGSYTFPASNITQVHHFIINSSGSVVLNNNLQVAGNLTLTLGTFNANNFGVTMSGAGMAFNNNASTGAFIPGTGVFTVSGSVTVGTGAAIASTDFYDVFISGTLIGMVNHTMKVQHNWTNNNIFTHGSNTVNFNGTSTMPGSQVSTFYNISITAGKTLTGPNVGINKQINVEKDWTSDGIFTANSCTVQFQVGNAESISGLTDPNFYNLTVNKTAGTIVTANRSITASNVTTMTNGIFDVQTFDLTGGAGVGFAATGGEIRFAKLATTLPQLLGTYSVTGGTITFYGNGTQTAKALNTSGTAQYYNLQIGLTTSANVTTVQLADVAHNITVAGDLTINKNSGGTNCVLDATASNAIIRMTGAANSWTNNAIFTAQAGTVDFDGTTTVAGSATTTFYNLTIKSAGAAGTLTGHATNMVMLHDWTNNGTYNHNNSLVTFNGTSTLFGTQQTTFYDVIINNLMSLTGHATNVNIADQFQNDGTFIHNNGTVTFNTATGKIRGANQTTFYNLTIAAAGILSSHPTNENVAGNFTNNNSFNANGAKVTFNGIGAQAIGGTSVTTFHNLDVNNTGGTITLNQNEIIDNTGVLNLILGPVAINKNTLTVNNGSTAAIIRTAGYLISEDNSLNGSGRANNSSFVIWAVNATMGAHVFPFGDIGGAYIPFTYNLTAGNAGNVTLATYSTNAVALVTPLPVPVTSVNDTTYKGIDDSPYVIHRFWYITSTGGSTANMIFTYSNPADIGFLSGGVNGSDGTGLRAQQWNAGTLRWLRFYAPSQSFNSSNVLGGNSVTISSFSGALTSTAPWTLALRVHPLPVELLGLKVSLNANKEANINWQTAQEVNSNHFVVERSRDGVNFNPISTVNGAGNSSTLNTYSTLDEDPLEGISYYRLKQVDFDGKYTYSAIVPLTNANFIDVIKVYPNPAESYTTVVFKSNEAMSIHISIYDITGKLTIQQKIDVTIGTNNYILDVSTLHSGIYNFVLTSDMKEDMKYEGKFVKN